MTFVISGPVLIGGGVMTIVFSVEVFSHFFLTLLLIWSDNQTRSKLYSWENVLNLVNETKTCVLQKYIWPVLMPPCNQSFQVCVRLYKANFQVCVRLYKANQRVRDPELDNLLNIHEVWNILSRKCSWIFSCGFQVKHWMDPQIIPYGWGLFSEGEEVRMMRWLRKRFCSHSVGNHSILVGRWKA